MKIENIIKSLNQTYSLYSLPFYIYKNDKLYYTIDKNQINLALLEHWKGSLGSAKDRPVYYLSPELLIIGKVYLNNDYTLYYGPSFITKPTTSIFIDVDFSDYKNLDFDLYLKKSKTVSFRNFISLLSIMDSFCNDRFIEPDLISTTHEHVSEEIKRETLSMNEETPRQNNYEYESLLISYVENGMPEEIRKYESFSGYTPNLAQTKLRHYKNALIILNSLCIRAAIRGGLDQDTSYQLGETYLHRIEAAQSLNDLMDINMHNQIPIDYANRVAQLKKPENCSPKISEAMDYIRENYYKRLYIEDIAEHVGLSKEYLSSLFKKETGENIPDYINSHKIRQAKALLKYSSLSISDISEMLSFSSQSYFQTVFYKVTGTTPNNYRKER